MRYVRSYHRFNTRLRAEETIPFSKDSHFILADMGKLIQVGDGIPESLALWIVNGWNRRSSLQINGDKNIYWV